MKKIKFTCTSERPVITRILKAPFPVSTSVLKHMSYDKYKWYRALIKYILLAIFFVLCSKYLLPLVCKQREGKANQLKLFYQSTGLFLPQINAILTLKFKQIIHENKNRFTNSLFCLCWQLGAGETALGQVGYESKSSCNRGGAVAFGATQNRR